MMTVITSIDRQSAIELVVRSAAAANSRYFLKNAQITYDTQVTE